jgi:hypothetical protein
VFRNSQGTCGEPPTVLSGLVGHYGMSKGWLVIAAVIVEKRPVSEGTRFYGAPDHGGALL